MSLTRRQLLLAVASTPLLPVLGHAAECPSARLVMTDEAGYYFDPTRWPDPAPAGPAFGDVKADARLSGQLIVLDLRRRADNLYTDNERRAFAMSRDSSRAELEALV